MEWKYMRGTGIALVAALALGLAGCGSSGDSDTAADDTPVVTPEPMPTPVAVTVPDAGYLDADNMPMAGMLMIAAGMTGTSGGVTFLCAAGGDDCEVTIADDGSVEATGGTVTASLTADAMTQVMTAKEMKADDEEAARLVRRNRAIGEDRALESAVRLVTGTPGTTSGIDVANIIPSRSAGKQASVRVTAPAGYAKVEDLMNGDWGGTRRSRVAGSNTDELVVFTDIEEPKLVQFYNFDRKATTPSRYADTGAPSHTNPYGPGDPLTPLALVTGGSPVAGLFTRGVLDASEFPQPGPTEGGVVTQRYRPPNTTATTLSFRGNYNGAGGTYTCTPTGGANTACVVTVTPSGTYASPDGWTFTPELNARAYQTDATFMSFGWWLRTPRSADGAYAFEYYANGQPFVAQTTTPTGTATYTGRAAGRYAMQEVGGTGVVDGMSGEFTAAASLTANFSAMSTGGTPAPTVEGTISGFEGGMDGMSGWLVTLNRQSLGNNATALAAEFTSGQIDPTASGFDGVTAMMGDQTAHGSWTGRFFGNQMTVGETPAAVNGAAPLGVGGTFQADNEAVSIAGAFGARR